MANQIERDVYVLQSKVKNPIEYVRLTNAIPIIFHFRDYDIPESSSAEVYVQKPSGKAVFDDASISGNDVTVTVTDQMFAELGFSELQIKITENAQELVTFSQPVVVKPNYTEGDADQSQNEGGFFDEAQQAIENANTAANAAQAAAEEANEAAEGANSAAQTAEEAAENIPETVKDAVDEYFVENPVQLDDPVLDGETLRFVISTTPTLTGTNISFVVGTSPSASLEQDVANLKEFAEQFDGKTLLTT